MWLAAWLLAVVGALLACDASATTLRGRAAARLASGGAGLSPTQSPIVPPGGLCTSPVPDVATLGCVDFVHTTMQALDLVITTIDAHGVGGDVSFLNQFFRPLLSALRYSLGQSFPGLNSNVCFANFKGSQILSAPATGFNSALDADKCNAIPVASQGEYMVFSFAIPVSVLPCHAFAGASKPGTMAAMCLVLSLCGADSLPTLGVALDKGMFGCLFGNDALVPATGGVAALVSQLTYQAMESVSLGLSLSNNLERNLTLYDTSGLVQVAVHGNLGVSTELSIASDKIGLPPWMQLKGDLSLLVALFGDPQRSTVFSHTVTDFHSFLTGLAEDFSVAATGRGMLAFKLKDMSRGVFPDLALTLGSVSAVISSASKANTGLDAGFYAYMEGAAIEAAVVSAIISTILPLIDVLIDEILGKGATALFVKYATPDGSASTKLGLGINAEKAGIYLQVPVGSIVAGLPPLNLIPGINSFLGALEFELRIRLSDGAVSFYVSYLKSSFLTMIWDSLLLVWRKATRFFEEVGEIVAVVSQDAHKFTQDEIEKCADEIARGVYDVGDELQDWAKTVVNAAGSGVVDAGNTVGDGLGDLGDKIVDGLDTVGDGLDDLGGKIVDGLDDLGGKIVGGLTG